MTSREKKRSSTETEGLGHNQREFGRKTGTAILTIAETNKILEQYIAMSLENHKSKFSDDGSHFPDFSIIIGAIKVKSGRHFENFWRCLRCAKQNIHLEMKPKPGH